jgi:hypothetical protein
MITVRFIIYSKNEWNKRIQIKRLYKFIGKISIFILPNYNIGKTNFLDSEQFKSYSLMSSAPGGCHSCQEICKCMIFAQSISYSFFSHCRQGHSIQGLVKLLCYYCSMHQQLLVLHIFIMFGLYIKYNYK